MSKIQQTDLNEVFESESEEEEPEILSPDEEVKFIFWFCNFFIAILFKNRFLLHLMSNLTVFCAVSVRNVAVNCPKLLKAVNTRLLMF